MRGFYFLNLIFFPLALQASGRDRQAVETVKIFSLEHDAHVQVAVIADGGTVLFETGSSKAVSRHRDALQLASISKTISAYLALSVACKVGYSLDTPAIFPVAPQVNPVFGDSIFTLRRLLSHTAGLNLHGFSGYSPKGAVPTLTQSIRGLSPANHPPLRQIKSAGVEHMYSGGGFLLLQDWIERGVKLPFEQVVKRDINQKFGIKMSTVAPKHFVDSYHYRRGESPDRYRIYPEIAAAGIWATAHDLAVFIQKSFEEAKKNSCLSLWLEPVTGDYGLGLVHRYQGRQKASGHSGANWGYLSLFAYDAKKREGIVILSSGIADVTPLFERMAEVFEMSQFLARPNGAD